MMQLFADIISQGACANCGLILGGNDWGHGVQAWVWDIKERWKDWTSGDLNFYGSGFQMDSEISHDLTPSHRFENITTIPILSTVPALDDC